MSVATIVALAGRSTFTATSRPSCRVARCTTASDAAAKGRSSIDENTDSSGRPRSSSTMARTCSNGIDGPSSSTPRIASASVWPAMLGDDAISWPSFTKVTPRSVTASARPRPRRALRRSWSRTNGLVARTGSRRCVATAPICARRRIDATRSTSVIVERSRGTMSRRLAWGTTVPSSLMRTPHGHQVRAPVSSRRPEVSWAATIWRPTPSATRSMSKTVWAHIMWTSRWMRCSSLSR